MGSMFRATLSRAVAEAIPARAFEAVDESCLMASPDSGRAAAKPGCPIG